MRQFLLVCFLFLLITTQNSFAQRKGLIFDKTKYESVPLAEDDKFGYSDDNLPSSISYKKYAPYAGNQGDYGTCVGWSSSYGALSIQYAKKMNITDRDLITFTAFCPYYIYNQFKDEYDFFCQSGGLYEEALEILFNKGAKRYYLPEYTCFSDYDNFSTNNASKFKIKNYYRLFDWDMSEFQKKLDIQSSRVNQIKKALANGNPVLWGSYVPPSFDNLFGQSLWQPTAEEREKYNTFSGHAMVIIGYDDNRHGGSFEVMNSWGETWGDKGFFYVKYDDADIFGHTAFYMDITDSYIPSSGCQLGDCKNDYGRYKWTSGEVYEGELTDGMFDGEGIYVLSNGEGYAGDWKESEKHGKGVQKYSDGSILEGYWKNNVYVGTTEPSWTTETEEKSTSIYDSFVENTTEETAPTTGCISGNCVDGIGKYIYSDGDIYEGSFMNSKRHGNGKYQYIEGDYYEGDWNYDSRDGLGYYKWPSGNEYIGYWANNSQNGKGTKYYTTGEVDAGEWKNGSFQNSESFGYSADEEKTQSNASENGTIFNRVKSGKPITPKHNQIRLKQGFKSIPKTDTEQKDEDFEFTNKVLRQLLRGIGKTDLTKPALSMIDSEKDVAYTNNKTGVHVSRKFAQLCKTFGERSEDAMSVVLAHELAHYFKDHFFCRDFGYAYGETEWASQMGDAFKTVHETGYFETQADEFGLFFSFTSGYKPFEVAEEVITKVYDNFSLPDEMTGYPPKDFRIEQIKLAQKNVENLIPLYEVGNYLSVLSSAKNNGIRNDLHANAIICYEHIINQKITTPEMYNNLGVNYMNMAIKIIPNDLFPYALPLEVDFRSRLFSTTGGGKGGTGGGLGYGADSTRIYENIIQAVNFFKEAIQLDGSYAPAYNNLAAANILLKEYDEAYAKARKARKLSKATNATTEYHNSIDLLALLSHLNDEPDDAQEYWEEALEWESAFAVHNIKKAKLEDNFDLPKPKVVKGQKGDNDDEEDKELTSGGIIGGFGNWKPGPSSVAYKYERPDFRTIEKINGETLSDIANEFLYDGKAIETYQIEDKLVEVGKADYEEGEITIYARAARGRILMGYYFYESKPTSTVSTSLGIKNGQTKEELRDTYGDPVNIISSATHHYWVYFNKNIIFKINPEQKVDGYIIYDVNL